MRISDWSSDVCSSDLPMKPDRMTDTNPDVIHHRPDEISRRSRLMRPVVRLVLKPLLRWIACMDESRLAGVQLHTAGKVCPDGPGLPLNYEIVGKVPGPVLGGVRPALRPGGWWFQGCWTGERRVGKGDVGS